MNFVSGNICYILEENKFVKKVKVMRKQGETYIVQRVGACGAMWKTEAELFETEEAAKASKKTTCAMVSPQLSIFPERSKILEI